MYITYDEVVASNNKYGLHFSGGATALLSRCTITRNQFGVHTETNSVFTYANNLLQYNTVIDVDGTALNKQYSLQ